MGRNNRDQTERMQIYFLSDVLVAVALLDLKVLNVQLKLALALVPPNPSCARTKWPDKSNPLKDDRIAIKEIKVNNF